MDVSVCSLENSDILQNGSLGLFYCPFTVGVVPGHVFLVSSGNLLISLVPTVFPVALVFCQETEGSRHGFQ